jgi:hypothetical protein
MFGKKLSEYVRFARWILVLVVIAFVARLSLSLTGASYPAMRWVSINLVLLVGLMFCSVAVHTTGFGSYKQLFGLLLVQNLFAHVLIAGGIVLGIVTGTTNAFTVPEVSGGYNGATWFHAAGHLLAGVLAAVVAWLIGSVILYITTLIQPPRLPSQ